MLICIVSLILLKCLNAFLIYKEKYKQYLMQKDSGPTFNCQQSSDPKSVLKMLKDQNIFFQNGSAVNRWP